MDIFSILSETRNPSISTNKQSQHRVLNKSMRIVVEAEEDKEDEKTSEEKPEKEDSKEDDALKADNDKEDEKEESSDNDLEDETNESDDNSDESLEDNDEIGPIGGMDNSESDSSEDSQEPEEQELPKDELDPDKTKAVALLDDTTLLYYSIKSIIDKLSNVDADTLESIKAFDIAKRNFVDLSDLLYDFITKRFNTNTYVKNLYIFNYFIQTYKINVDILEKTLKSQS